VRRAALFLLPVLGGCMVGPDYHRPAAPVPVAFKELAGWKPGQPLDAIDRGAWWSVYHDPLLDRLEREVEVSNQTLAAAYAAYRDSQAIVQEARANLFPVLSGTASDTRSSGAGGGIGSSGSVFGTGRSTRTTYSLQGNGSWELDVWGQIRRTVESDVAGAQASAADIANARLSAQATLATDYFQLRAADALEKLLSDTVRDYQRALQITQNQYDVGVAARSDVLAAQVQLESTQASLVNVGVARAQYEHAIAVLTGHPPADLTIAPGALATDVPVPPVSVPSLLLQRRPDIAAAERTMRQQNALIGAAVATYYPDISLSALYGYSGDPISSLISASNRVWSLAASGTETIFQGGARSAQVAAARAVYDEAVANYRQTVLTAFQQVEDQLATLRILEQEARAEAVAVRDAKLSVAVALNEYRAGTQPYTTVITAENTALADEQSALTIQQNRLVASAALIEALGGGWDTAQLPDKNDLQRGIPFLPDALDPTLPKPAPRSQGNGQK
jgi:NodT family efflux transporter outer membrane factor (OMF) lipoprotein